MNRKIIFGVREFFVTQLNHWALLPIALLLFGVTQNISECEEPNMWIWLAMGFLPFAFYFLRVFMHRFFFLLGGHLVVLVLLAFLLSFMISPARMIYLFMGICYTIYSVVLRLRKNDFLDAKVVMPLAVGISAVSAFFLRYMGHSKWDSLLLLALIAVFGLYFFTSYLESYLHFLIVNESSTGHIPEREILISGSRLMGIFVLSSMAILFLASHLEWLEVIVSLLREGIFVVLRLILLFLPKWESDTPPMESAPISEGAGMALSESGEPFFLWSVLETLFIIAILCGLVALIIWLLIRLVRFIRERMKWGRRIYTPQVWESVYDVREKCALEKKKKEEEHSLFFRMSVRERIRRLYRNHIKNVSGRLSRAPEHRETSDPALRTAREWGTILSEEELAPLYEKARYSSENVTVEELRRMKEVCRRKVIT
ncbi:MAG: hypothetical protein J1E64_09475 [Acetatifactor sp.]|nr:hypothetical protein [Acetatifactor sp.]